MHARSGNKQCVWIGRCLEDLCDCKVNWQVNYLIGARMYNQVEILLPEQVVPDMLRELFPFAHGNLWPIWPRWSIGHVERLEVGEFHYEMAGYVGIVRTRSFKYWYVSAALGSSGCLEIPDS